MMQKENIDEIVRRYNSGDCDHGDLQRIERLLEEGHITLDDLNDVREMYNALRKFDYASPSDELTDRFYGTLAEEKRRVRRFQWEDLFSWEHLYGKVMLASMMFIGGLALGYALFNSGSTDNKQMELLSTEVKSLKEMMMLSLLEKESATDRLRAVGISQELDESSSAVINALVKTLNNDENVNVRLAALDALRAYGRNSDVRKELIKSIVHQTSPLVQVALADLMVEFQEKSCVDEFEKVLKDRNTPPEVKTRIRKSIEVLI
jgi:hypothetical protein